MSKRPLKLVPVVCVECGRWLGDYVERASKDTPRVVLQFCSAACNTPTIDLSSPDEVRVDRTSRLWS